MVRFRIMTRRIMYLFIVVSSVLLQVNSASLSDVLNLDTDSTLRVPRDNKYYLNRQQQQDSQRDASSTTRILKPEDSPEARENPQETSVGKRCSRCDGYSDYRTTFSYPRRDNYYSGRYQNDPYDRSRYEDRYDRYDDRFLDRSYERDRGYDRGDRGTSDPYDYYDYNYDRDASRRPSYTSGYSGRDLYDRDRYGPRDNRYFGRDRSYDKSYDRGIGYDNIGYDYRGYDQRGGYRPSDETYRGTSGFDSSGRGYYYNRPEGGRSGVYASSWGYGRDDRDRGYRDPGSYRGLYRPRDYHNYGTSYLYDRHSSTTSPPGSHSDRDNSVTDSPHDETSSTG